jgi:hypothetical protein
MNIPLNVIKYVLFDYLDMMSSLHISTIFDLNACDNIWKQKGEQYKVSFGYYSIKYNSTSQTYYRDACDSHSHYMCVECCCSTIGLRTNLGGLNLCYNCSTLPAYTTMCATLAKYIYHLSDADLAELRTIETKNRLGWASKLYIGGDLMSKYCQKYSVKEYAANEITWLNPNPEKTRRAALTIALSDNNMPLRDDSKLCQGYIAGSLTDWTINQIVLRMCQVKYLIEYWQECFVEAKREVLAYESVFDRAERIAMRRYGKYPDKFPWISYGVPSAI